MGFSLDAPPGGGRVYDYKSRVKSPGCEQSGWDIDTQYISNTSYSKKIVYISINNKRESEWDGCDFLFLNTLLYINRGGGMKEHQGNIPNFWRNPSCLQTPHRDKRNAVFKHSESPHKQ